MRFWASAVVAAAFSLSPTIAQGYIQGSAGGTTTPWLDISGLGYKMNTGYNVGISGGIKLTYLSGPNWDLRGDIMHSQNQYECCTAHLGATSFMADLIYHINLGMSLKPYVGAGLGAVVVNYGNALTGPHETRTSFGYQALAGVEYPLFGRFSAFGEYRYVTANDTAFTSIGKVEYKAHNFMMGLKLSL